MDASRVIIAVLCAPDHNGAMEPTIFKLTNIPAPVLEELTQTLGAINFSHYGTVDEGTVSRRLEYQSFEPLTETVSAVCSATCDPITVDGTTHQLCEVYTARINFSDNSVRGVVPSGMILCEKRP